MESQLMMTTVRHAIASYAWPLKIRPIPFAHARVAQRLEREKAFGRDGGVKLHDKTDY